MAFRWEGGAAMVWKVGPNASVALMGRGDVDASQGFSDAMKHKGLPSTWKVTSSVRQGSNFQRF